MPAAVAVSSERVSMGTDGLDKLIEGGLVRGSTYLVAGQAGTGKSIMSMQYLVEGARKGEVGLYLTLEQKVDEIVQDMSKFSWGPEMRKFVDEGKIVIAPVEPTSVLELQDTTIQYVNKYKVSRFVLDSLTVAAFAWKMSSMDIGKVRNEIFSYMRSIEGTGVTSILITEIPEGEEKRVSRLGFEEFIADGIIVLRYITLGQSANRTIEIRKMRRTKMVGGMHNLDITKDGVRVTD